VLKRRYQIPRVEIEPSNIKTLMISEAPPENLDDCFYASNGPFYFQTTAQAFSGAVRDVSSMQDELKLGVYVTTAIKCAKTTYSISPKTIENCSGILEKEIDLFSKIRCILLMGDTYKVRKGKYFYKHLRIFPSYLQTGKSYLIEKSKRKMIAEDIKAELEYH